MNSIVINYKITNTLSPDNLEDIINGCRNIKNYKIILNLYDFSLRKNDISNIKDTDNLKVYWIKKDYEELNNANDIILSEMIKYSDSVFVTILSNEIIINPEIFDTICFDSYCNKNIGFLYFDYTVSNNRCFLRSQASGLNIGIPVLFWSTKTLINYLSKDDILESVHKNSIGVHIPKNLCTININEQEKLHT